MKKEISKESIEHKVLISPAMASQINSKQVFFLFSLQQVEDIQKELTVYDVPFSASFVEGITLWRDVAIPVISLESYVGLTLAKSEGDQRFAIIRSTRMSQEGIVEMRSAIRTEREIKMIPIPDSSTSIKPNGWIRHERVKGVFEWDEGFIVVPETDKLFQEEIREF